MAALNSTRCEITTVLVIGDNRLATCLTNGLLQGLSNVHLLVPKSSSLGSEGLFHVHKADVSSSEALVTLFKEIQPDVVFSAHAGGSYHVQERFINAAIDAQITRFVAAEFTQDSLNTQIQGRLPPCRERARVIQYLTDRAAAGRISWTAVATGTELEHGLISGNIGFDLKWHSATVHGTGEEQFAASSASWIGQVALSIVSHWREVQNRYLYAAGMVMTAREIIQSLEKNMESRWEIGYVDVEDGVREAEMRLDRGFPDAGMFLMERSVLYDHALDAVRPFQQKDAKQELALASEHLDGVIKRVVHDYNHHGKDDCGCA